MPADGGQSWLLVSGNEAFERLGWKLLDQGLCVEDLVCGGIMSGQSTTRYAELHCLTNFSFLNGASHPEELVIRAAEIGLSALAVTDRNSLAGVVRAYRAARVHGMRLVIGSEIHLSDAPPLVLLACSRAGYGALSRLITVGRRRAVKGRCHLELDDVVGHSQGLIACLTGDYGLCDHDRQAAAVRLRDVFGDGCYLMAEVHKGPQDAQQLERLRAASERVRVPLIAANAVHYHIPQRQKLHDVLCAIRHQCSVEKLGHRRFSNSERHLKSAAQMRGLFAGMPAAVERAAEVADRCHFTLDELKYQYPEEHCPAGRSAQDYLSQLTWSGAEARYPSGIPDQVRTLIAYELQLISELRYEAYFLTVWDLVRFARSRGILCQGRGSAANSAVCYCLGVTCVDPDRIDLLFERFISKQRDEAPDIDVDFEHERREEVLQYIYSKYGRERAAMTAEVITYRPRSAVRDIGKALGLSRDRVDLMTRSIGSCTTSEDWRCRLSELEIVTDSGVGRSLMELAPQLIGFPRHLSQHVGGMVMTQGPLSEIVPIENAAMGDSGSGRQSPSRSPRDVPRTVIQWDKDDLDVLGILKVDCLALGMLTAIRKCLAAVNAHYGRQLALNSIPGEDPRVYEMIQKADTVGVFQIESRAQMSMLPRMRPRCFYDLVIEVAIVRPGPIQGDMVHPYLRRRNGEEPVEYLDDRIRNVLQKTLGVPIFQEQAMRLAVVAAGFSPGEADQLRRAMGAWRRPGVMEQLRSKLVDGLLENGYPLEFAERLFRQIQGFGEYGFPESHAASFAAIVYVSSWLKCYYPAAFTTALLNSQPMGFYAPAQLVSDVRKHGVAVLPIDINRSAWDCRLEPVEGVAQREMVYGIRLGFRLLKGLRHTDARRIVSQRGQADYTSFADCVQRTGLTRSVMTRLARADVFAELGSQRRDAIWNARRGAPSGGLFAQQEPGEAPVQLPVMDSMEQIVADYRSSGLSLKGHPLTPLREQLRRLRVVRAASLGDWPDSRRVTVAGLVLLRQRPGTANGVTFVTLEDETGFANLIVRPDVWSRFRAIAGAAQGLLARGTLQRQDEVVHVLVDYLDDLSSQLAGTEVSSRDFR
ncbi:MAG: error-prone DNA polymerase [Planctomycetaceae bacterium]